MKIEFGPLTYNDNDELVHEYVYDTDSKRVSFNGGPDLGFTFEDVLRFGYNPLQYCTIETAQALVKILQPRYPNLVMSIKSFYIGFLPTPQRVILVSTSDKSHSEMFIAGLIATSIGTFGADLALRRMDAEIKMAFGV